MPEKLSQGPRTTYDASRVGAGLSRGPNLRKKLTAAPWSNTWPAPGATLDLDFANNRGFVRGVGQGGVMDAVTFTRASNGNWVDSTGLLRTGAGTFTGTANATGVNLLSVPQDFDNASWVKSSASVVANVVIAPDGTQTADKLVEDATSNEHFVRQNTTLTAGYTVTGTIRAKQGERNWIRLRITDTTANTAQCWFNLATGAKGSSQTPVGSPTIVSYTIDADNNGFWFCRITVSMPGGSGATCQFAAYTATGDLVTTYAGDGVSGIYIWGAQLELGSTATTYYPTNINAPRFDWASTASTGAGTAANPYVIPLRANATSNGLLIEESRTNRLLWCRDATQSSWTKTLVTAAKDQTGIDGVANAASSLTATLGGGTCVQSITLALGSRTGSIYLKRITGTGDVQFSVDGVTYTTVDLSNGLWNRIVVSGSITNPMIGIKLATSGDAVAMDYGQVEDGAFATTPILTTTATATRSADVATMSGQNFDTWFDQKAGTFRMSAVRYNAVLGNTVAVVAAGTTLSGTMGVYTSASNTDISLAYYGSPNVFLNSGTISVGNTSYAFSFNANNLEFQAAKNSLPTSFGYGSATTNVRKNILYLGAFSTGGSYLNGCLQRIAFAPFRASTAALQNLSGQAT